MSDAVVPLEPVAGDSGVPFQPETGLNGDGSQPAQSEPAAATPHRNRSTAFSGAVQSLIITLVCAVFIVTFLEQPFQIPSPSMENTLLVGDYLLVDKVHYAPGGVWGHILPYEQIRRGDIIVFHFPVDPTQHFVKRVIGIPGDRVRLAHKQVMVNGEPMHEPYAVHIPGSIDHYRDDFPQPYPVPDQTPKWWVEMRQHVRDGELIVPPGRYFVMGDNRDNSDDSRFWGFVPRENVEGRPLLIYWSMDPRGPMASTLADDKLSRLADIFYYMFRIPRWRRAMHVVR